MGKRITDPIPLDEFGGQWSAVSLMLPGNTPMKRAKAAHAPTREVRLSSRDAPMANSAAPEALVQNRAEGGSQDGMSRS
jgi:hypothetical protein